MANDYCSDSSASRYIVSSFKPLKRKKVKVFKTVKSTKLIDTRLQIDQLINSWKQCKCIIGEKAIRKTENKIKDGTLLTYFREQARKAGVGVKAMEARASGKYPNAFTPCKRTEKSPVSKPAASTSSSSKQNAIGHCPYCGSKDINKLYYSGKYKCRSCNRTGFVPAITKEERELLQSAPPTVIQRKKVTAKHDTMADRVVTRSYTVPDKDRLSFRHRMNLRSKDFVRMSIQCELCEQFFSEGYRYMDREGWISYLCKSCAKQIGGPSGRKTIISTPMGGMNKRY